MLDGLPIESPSIETTITCFLLFRNVPSRLDKAYNMELATVLARRRSINTAGGEVVIESGGNLRSLGHSSYYKVGTRIQARFAGGDDFFPGVVSALGQDGTIDIDYDDGDIERCVHPSLVRLERTASCHQVIEELNLMKLCSNI